ncbi:uncharacterized protein At3g60930, chloroplastic-like [Eutrema salsugineum]|uniref:uncharacterized protein At3g60930, chloroplastic-like n=1 Tax=Eutrema salsugineum TaxID=72664 RepID=UPI000CED0158|nr:uncharacterized protein At3g60930, chloroplastic-like [Eutrema salsugineum]
MSSCSGDSLEPLFNYETSRTGTVARSATGSSEASTSPNPSNNPAKDQDLSNSPSPSGACSVNNEVSDSTSCSWGPVNQEEVDYTAVKAEEEVFPFNPVEARLELERLIASRGASSSGKGKPKRVKRQKPDPPGSTLEVLRHRFGISEAVEFVVPEKSDRADKPPENHFTLYEAFFELCFLWLPIPGVILEYLWEHGILIGQIMPRGLRHMIGITVWSFECGVEVELGHLLNLLEIRRAPGGGRFYISNKSNRRIIGGFPSKDQFWTERFFYVLVNEASVGEGFVHKTKTVWRPLVRSFLPPVPNDLFSVRDTLAARKVNWRKHFSFERIERVRAILAGVSISSSSSNSSGDTREKMVIITLRDKKRREAEEIARRAEQAAHVVAEAVPRDDPPRLEGEEVARAADETALEATAQEAAPEVEPGEIVPAASGENSAARDKTPPTLAILALPKQSRPPTSNLLKHDTSRKRSAMEKGKGVAIQKDEPSKKKRKPAPSEPTSRKLVVDDPAASAVIFARINNANTRLPPPDQLRRSKSYAAMAQRGTKFVAAINEMMAGYELDLVKNERYLEEARKKVRRELTAKFQERLAKVEEGLAKLEKAKSDENELRQIKGNLVMIEELRKPDGSLDSEEAKLKVWEAEYVDDEAYDCIASEIRGGLVYSPVSPDSDDTFLGNELIEETALTSVLRIRPDPTRVLLFSRTSLLSERRVVLLDSSPFSLVSYIHSFVLSAWMALSSFRTRMFP